MIPDAELLSLLCTILTKLDVGEFTVKVGPGAANSPGFVLKPHPGQPP
jgi:hypothetical protein